MQTRLFLLTLTLASTAAVARPPREVVEACVRADPERSAPRYTDLPARHFFETQEDGSDNVTTTIRYGKEEIGIWERPAVRQSGLVYNGRRVTLDDVTRLSGERPEPFTPYLAMWGIVKAGARSYICITFNFDGLGQSGSFQSVRGVYLFERHARSFRPFYTVGRVTPGGVVLAR
jgi:hypothetical protein